ncbi:hypothetical protein [Parabacteroides sp. Marseille-P3160]|uniref:hypothetical protein n=1 Tax=Parabacteroides sp. Marseille-P3160 TaxID=1917887 RepID=UPI001118224D|nr:hypothetical protein [Parabacteroides sp. Marseille-P3160]
MKMYDVAQLDDCAMKSIVGGNDGYDGTFTAGTFNCSCSNGANPPFSSSWTKTYSSTKEIIDDISGKCVEGKGGCRAAS